MAPSNFLCFTRGGRNSVNKEDILKLQALYKILHTLITSHIETDFFNKLDSRSSFSHLDSVNCSQASLWVDNLTPQKPHNLSPPHQPPDGTHRISPSIIHLVLAGLHVIDVSGRQSADINYHNHPENIKPGN